MRQITRIEENKTVMVTIAEKLKAVQKLDNGVAAVNITAKLDKKARYYYLQLCSCNRSFWLTVRKLSLNSRNG